MKILVTRGAGHLGREFIQTAVTIGHHVRIASRRPPPADAPEAREWATLDLSTGEGLRESLMGIDAVVHAASDPKNTDAVDVEDTRRLAGAACDAGPEPMTLAEAAAAWKAARDIRKPTIPIPVPGRLGTAFRAGYNTAPDGERGVLGWRQWLEQRASSRLAADYFADSAN